MSPTEAAGGAERARRVVIEAPIDALRPGDGQPRQVFDDGALAELAASIAAHGILQPLLVAEGRREGGADRYRIIAGERRWRAAIRAGLQSVPVLVLRLDEARGREVSLIENLHRADLRPLELAQAYDALLRASGMTHEQLAARLGKSRVSITNCVRLLGLGYAAQRALATGRISEGHGRALLGVSGEAQERALAEVLTRDLSVRQTETLVRRLASPPGRPVRRGVDTGLGIVADALRDVLGARVALTGSDAAGRIVIEYHSREELERLCAHIGGEALAERLG